MTNPALQPTQIIDKNGKGNTVRKKPPVTTNSPVRGAGAGTPPQTAILAREFTLQPETEGQTPFPQANSIPKLLSVVDLIASGINTKEGISIGIGSESVTDRVALYYADALVYLGVASKDSSFGLSTYSLTANGEEFSALDPSYQLDALSQAISEIDLVQIYRELGEDALTEHAQENYDYSDDTIGRRVACIASWSAQCDDNALDETMKDTNAAIASAGDRAEEARAMVADQKEAAQARRERERRSDDSNRETCNECFTMKAVDGSCLC